MGYGMVLFIEVADYKSGATIQVNVNAIKAILPMSDSTSFDIEKRFFTMLVVEGTDGGYKTSDTQEQIIEKIGAVQGQWPVYVPTQKGDDAADIDGEVSIPKVVDKIINPLKYGRHQ